MHREALLYLYYGSEWAIRIAMLLVVPQKRSPAAARTWLLFIFLLPWPGLVLYALVGRPYVSRRRVDLLGHVSTLIRTSQEMWRKATGRSRPGLAPAFEPAMRLAEKLGDFQYIGGNAVELLPDYQQSIDRLVADIDAATHHAHLIYYIFADDATGLRVIEALERAVKRGVSARVLMDSLGNKRWRAPVLKRLRAGGIDAMAVLPVRFQPWRRARFDMRNHRKIAVLDGKIGYVGSQNLVDRAFKPGIVNRELVARVRGPLVAQLQAVLLADRYYETEERIGELGHFPPFEEAGSVFAQCLPSGPGYSQENNQRLIVSLIHAANERVVLTTPYFIPDEPLYQAMQTAATRGVEVHLVVSRDLDQLLVGYAQRSFYDQLLAAGVQIHIYYEYFLHAKHLSVDGDIALVGSSNFDIRSFALNAEVSAIFYDKGVAADLRKIEESYFAKSQLLTKEEWAKRGFLTRVAQNTARLADSFL
jgi:cardiolipin synthase